jgi:16S rRNA G966 N2-methylase RsmD
VLVDLTGGYGVDTYFMSEHFAQVHYVEQNEELCRIATHNFALTRPHIQVHNTHAEEFLRQEAKSTPKRHERFRGPRLGERLEARGEKWVIYIDPARRDKHGGKVFRIEDCEPNVVELLPQLLDRAERIIIKLSPMLDITAALRSLQIPMDVDIVAVNNEVKEVVLWSKIDPTPCRIHAVNLGGKTTEWSFTQEEERNAPCMLWDAHGGDQLTEGTYIYEPNAAILKAGAYKLVGARYGLQKWGQNTHLYLSTHYVEDFPGRVWRMKEVVKKDTKDIRASVMTRNYPLTADQLRKKLKAKEGDTMTIIGARLGDKPIVVLAEKC